MFPQSRWPIWSAPTLVAGLFWISTAAEASLPLSLPLWIVGSALLASGGGQLFAPGDHRMTQIGALAGLLGALLSLPLALGVGLGNALLLLLTAGLGSWGAGRLALDVEKHVDGVPTPETSPSVVAKVAGDELILGFEQVLGTAGFALDGTTNVTGNTRTTTEYSGFTGGAGIGVAFGFGGYWGGVLQLGADYTFRGLSGVPAGSNIKESREQHVISIGTSLGVYF